MKLKRGSISLSMEQLIYVILAVIVLMAVGFAARGLLQNLLN